jgi:hypothetical protein
MRNNIIKLKAEQRLSSIATAEDTPLAIDAAFDNLMREFTIIADLSTSKRKSGIGKSCPWWNPRAGTPQLYSITNRLSLEPL